MGDLVEIILQCDHCNTEFESDVADVDRNGLPRCPQCGLSDSHRVARTDYQRFIIRKSTKFR